MTPPTHSTGGLLRSALSGRGPELRWLLAWSTVQALPAFLSGRVVAEAIDDGFLAGRTEYGLAWLSLLGMAAVAGAWATRETILGLARIVEPFRDTLARLAATGALRRSTDAGAAGDTAGVARLTHQVELVRDAFASILTVGQSFVVVTVGALIGMSTLMAEMLLFVVPPLVAGVVLFLVAVRHIAARLRDSIMAEERIAESTSALASGMRDVVACGAEDRAAPMVGEHIEAHARATRALARLTAVRSTAVAIGGVLPVLMILVAGSWLVSRGASAGMIFGGLTYVLLGVHPAVETFVSGISGPGLRLLVTLRRIVETSHEPSVADPQAAPPAWLSPGDHGVRLSGVRFAYGPFAQPVICDLDLSIPDGEHLAIVGPSGAGKSTLANVIAGVLAPQAGEVRLGDVPLRRLDPATLVRHRVLIPQEAYVFAGSLHENLAYLREDVSREDIDEAVRLLGMGALVQRMGGYDAELDPAVLSTGQRQLVTLVRAYVSPARLVILDEASCHLDPGAEAIVEQAFARRPGTFVVIAHRISSALRAQRILVLDGTEVLYGSHEDLLQRSPLYRDLVGHWQSGDECAA
jgi:ABC-type multidrug transport system fused ATPase/permease subunit